MLDEDAGGSVTSLIEGLGGNGPAWAVAAIALTACGFLFFRLTAAWAKIDEIRVAYAEAREKDVREMLTVFANNTAAMALVTQGVTSVEAAIGSMAERVNGLERTVTGLAQQILGAIQGRPRGGTAR